MITWKCFLINSLKSIWPPLHRNAKKRGIKHLNFKSIVLKCIIVSFNLFLLGSETPSF